MTTANTAATKNRSEIREIDEMEWDGYAGAEPFADGKRPLVCGTLEDAFFVCGKGTLEVYIEIPGTRGEQSGYTYSIDEKTTQALARHILAGMVEAFKTDRAAALKMFSQAF